jgi:hypothetical protein
VTPQLWLLLLTRVASGVLITQGRPELGGLLNDLASAAKQGKNVDDILAQVAAKWEAEGPPSFEDIATHRQSIQARMDN